MQPRTADGFDAVYVGVDRLTKMAHYVPTRTLHTATQLAQLSLWEVVPNHSLPATTARDRDLRFAGNFWRAFITANEPGAITSALAAHC
jgi:hypothetical protein